VGEDGAGWTAGVATTSIGVGGVGDRRRAAGERGGARDGDGEARTVVAAAAAAAPVVPITSLGFAAAAELRPPPHFSRTGALVPPAVAAGARLFRVRAGPAPGGLLPVVVTEGATNLIFLPAVSPPLPPPPPPPRLSLGKARFLLSPPPPLSSPISVAAAAAADGGDPFRSVGNARFFPSPGTGLPLPPPSTTAAAATAAAAAAAVGGPTDAASDKLPLEVEAVKPTTRSLRTDGAAPAGALLPDGLGTGRSTGLLLPSSSAASMACVACPVHVCSGRRGSVRVLVFPFIHSSSKKLGRAMMRVASGCCLEFATTTTSRTNVPSSLTHPSPPSPPHKACTGVHVACLVPAALHKQARAPPASSVSSSSGARTYTRHTSPCHCPSKASIPHQVRTKLNLASQRGPCRRLRGRRGLLPSSTVNDWAVELPRPSLKPPHTYLHPLHHTPVDQPPSLTMAQGMNKLSKKGLAAQKGKKAHAKASSKRTAAKKGSEYQQENLACPLLPALSLFSWMNIVYACGLFERLILFL